MAVEPAAAPSPEFGCVDCQLPSVYDEFLGWVIVVALAIAIALSLYWLVFRVLCKIDDTSGASRKSRK